MKNYYKNISLFISFIIFIIFIFFIINLYKICIYTDKEKNITNYNDLLQPDLFNNNESLEKQIKKLINMSIKSQNNLFVMLSNLKKILKKNNIIISLYNPNIKSYNSILEKTNINNKNIRYILDIYRGAIIVNDINYINYINDYIQKNCNKYGFKIINYKNRFINPKKSGYRDINLKLKDINNNNLIGELQIHYCPIKKISELFEHKIYKMLKTLPENKKKKLDLYLNILLKYIYDKEFNTFDKECLALFQ